MNTQAATYNTESGELFLPTGINNSKSLKNVTVKLNSDGTYFIKNSTDLKLPLLCTDHFSQTTFELVKTASSISQIESILGCKWKSLTTSHSYATEDRPASEGVSALWLDSKCSVLVVSIHEMKVKLNFKKNYLGCNPIMDLRSRFFYNLQNNIFFIKNVLINHTTLATNVIFKFDNKNQYELLHYTLPEHTEPPIICHSFTRNDFDAISKDMSPDEINKMFNCQWQTTGFGGFEEYAYTWIDHDCNKISARSGYKVFIEVRYGRCSL